ncbi:MAG: hypothetical protein Q7S00_06660, partial [bacterium]|nr:hypothetical protein [bacterium]
MKKSFIRFCAVFIPVAALLLHYGFYGCGSSSSGNPFSAGGDITIGNLANSATSSSDLYYFRFGYLSSGSCLYSGVGSFKLLESGSSAYFD